MNLLFRGNIPDVPRGLRWFATWPRTVPDGDRAPSRRSGPFTSVVHSHSRVTREPAGQWAHVVRWTRAGEIPSLSG